MSGRAIGLVWGALTLLTLGSGCTRDDRVTCDGDDPDLTRPDHWARASHCRGVEPDYARVFDESALTGLTVTLDPEVHQAMLDDLDAKMSGSSAGTPDLDELPEPIWVPATVTYAGATWTGVGMRYKGHSSLKAAWNGGVRKLSFLLDFDHFEEALPQLADQRFFGFKRLSFGNAFNDPSLLREKVAYEIFRAAGVPAPAVTFVPVTLDAGAGPVYLGLYTLVEDPGDRMLERRFGPPGEPEGNLYKPWGDAARWRSVDDVDGGVSAWEEDIESHFEKATNDEVADWSDIAQAIERLHGARDVPSQWRADLLEVLDVDAFLRTLAVNQVLMNWDSYGCMHHNYYVYANPADAGRFVWFPWDLNEAMLDRAQDGCPDPGSVLLDEIVSGDPEDPGLDRDWPLIRLLLTDGVFRARYRELVAEVLDGPFAAAAATGLIRRYHELVAPYVVGPIAVETFPYTNTSAERFLGSLDEGEDALLPHVAARRAAVEAALAEGE